MAYYRFTEEQIKAVPQEQHSPRQWSRYLHIPYYYFMRFVEDGVIETTQDAYKHICIEGSVIQEWMRMCNNHREKNVYRVADKLTESQAEEVTAILLSKGLPPLKRLNKSSRAETN